MIPAPYADVLRRVARSLTDLPVAWAITGSTGMALQGVQLEVHDVDLQTSAAGAYAIGERLAAWAVTPVCERIAPHIRSHLGVFEIDGLKVEVMGGLQKRVEGVWEPPVDIGPLRCWVRRGDVTLPVLSLVYEEQAYRKLGRIERADLLRNWLEDRSRGRET